MKAQKLSSFCKQLSLLMGAGIPLDESLRLMAEDFDEADERKLLMQMADDIEIGESLASVLERTGAFPAYVVKMSNVGQETGNLEIVLRSLSAYYEKEDSFAKAIKRAVTYPVIMLFMLVVVVFVLLTKVMPIFESVYMQLGAQFPPITKRAVEIGSVFSGAVLIFIVLLIIMAGILALASYKGKNVGWTERILGIMKEKSKLSEYFFMRRFSAIMDLAIKSGIGAEKGLEMVLELINARKIAAKIDLCITKMSDGTDFYEALRDMELYRGIDLQMLKVGNATGNLDVIFGELAEKYEQAGDDAIESAIARFEPTMVVILAVIVGLILLSVMMPLVGIMAAIG